MATPRLDPSEPLAFKPFEPPKLDTYVNQDPYKYSAWYKARKYTLEELWTAIDTHDVDLAEKCLKAGLSADYCRWTGSRPPGVLGPSSSTASSRSLVHNAVIRNNAKAVRLLIKYGADLTGSASAAHCITHEVASRYAAQDVRSRRLNSDQWSTPLHAAALTGRVELMTILLDEGGADINAQNAVFRTPLHSAVQGMNEEAAKFLLNRRASVDVDDSHGITPLAMSALFGRLDLTKLMLSYGAFVDHKDIYGETSLYNAALKGHTNIVRFLSANGADPDVCNLAGLSAFFKAASTFDTTTMDTLVDCGANVDSRDANGCTPLIRAAMAKNHALVKHLLRYGCDVHATDNDDWTALEASMISGDEDTTLLLLLSGGADVTISSHTPTPLHHAATHGCTSVARFLLRPNQSHVSAIDARDEEGDTALILAASHNHVGILRQLLRSGASHSATNMSDNTALEHAAYWGNYACCLELVRAGATFRQVTYDALARGRGDHDSVMHSKSPQRRRGDRTLDFDAITRRFVPQSLELPPYSGRGESGASSFARSIDPVPRMREKQGKPPLADECSPNKGTSAAVSTVASTLATSTAGPLESVRSSESMQSATPGGVRLSSQDRRPSNQSNIRTERSPQRDSPAVKLKKEVSADPFEACIPETRVEQIFNNYITQQGDQNIGASTVLNAVGGTVNLVSTVLGII